MPYTESSQAASDRPFIVTRYDPDIGGALTPKMPSSCIFATSDGKACRLTVDHLRKRKTGPCFPLTVVRCAEHGHAFTLYPRGHVPWGRRAVVLVDPDGDWTQQ
jgi:hypothetical protein